MNKNFRMTLHSKTQNLRLLKQFYLVILAKERMFLQKNAAGVVLMPLIDLNSSFQTKLKTIQKKDQEQGILTPPISIFKNPLN